MISKVVKIQSIEKFWKVCSSLECRWKKDMLYLGLETQNCELITNVSEF